MTERMIMMKCPGCGAPVGRQDAQCRYCDRPVMITTFHQTAGMSVQEMNRYAAAYRAELAQMPEDGTLNTSAAMCYLKLGLFDEALSAFEKAQRDNFENSEVFFYAAVCLFRGETPFLATHAIVEKAERYLKAALMIEERGIYYYFLAYLGYEYYEQKHLRARVGYESWLDKALQAGLTVYDVELLFEIMGTEKPDCL